MNMSKRQGDAHTRLYELGDSVKALDSRVGVSAFVHSKEKKLSGFSGIFPMVIAVVSAKRGFRE